MEIRERSAALSRFAPESGIGSGGLDTSVVALVSDVVRGGEPVIGYGFGSMGRFSQSGLIRGRFGQRLLAAFKDDAIRDAELDPLALWPLMMAGEKPGGHGERCVAVGTLDMALWDLAAKLADQPLYRFLAERLGRTTSERVLVYAAGGYRYPHLDPEQDRRRLADEVRGFLDLGYTHLKIKIADGSIAEDHARIEAVLQILTDPGRLAVDAMNRYSTAQVHLAGQMLRPYGLWWWEDICDPLDYHSQAIAAEHYQPPIAAGEALFSAADARNLLCYGGLRPNHDRLVFDPVHCYGIPGYLQIVDVFERAGWNREAFWPHGGHLFSIQVAAALGLGGSEVNPFAFQPFGGLSEAMQIRDGSVSLPDDPGIGVEARPELAALFRSLLDE